MKSSELGRLLEQAGFPLVRERAPLSLMRNTAASDNASGFSREIKELPMGMFVVKVKLASLASPGRAEEVSLLVDRGATLSWLPREILQRLGVAPLSRLPFTLADGRTLEREVSAVLLTIDGRKVPVEVAFGEPGEEAVLGATALEGLGLVVDPVAKKLLPRNLFALDTRL